MSASVKVSGTFRDSAPYVKVGGSWRFAPEAWTKISGVWRQWFAASGTNDSTFNQADNFDMAQGTVNSIAIQPDGKIIATGSFRIFGGRNVGAVVRLNPDGTIDNDFINNIGIGANTYITTAVIQSDNKILLGGAFVTWNGTTVNRIVRLNANGTLDTAFTANTGSGADSDINHIAIQSDGKILVGGSFTTWNGTTANNFIRLNSNGTVDTGFMANVGSGSVGGIISIGIQQDGKIILVGYLTSWNGLTVNGIVRLESNGTIDSAFSSNTGSGTGGMSSIDKLLIQPDGKIIISGYFFEWNGTSPASLCLIRLNSNGTIDSSFQTNIGTGLDQPARVIFMQTDGKIFIGGDFTSWNSTATTNRIVRINSDGTRDVSFTTNSGTAANSSVFAAAIDSSNAILIGGSFTTFNGTTVNRFAKVSSSGSLVTYGTINGFDLVVTSVAIQSDQKIVAVGSFRTFNGVTVNRIIRLNSDGTRDTAFTVNTGTGANATVQDVAIQSDGKILLVGDFSTWNGVTVNRIVRLNSDGTRDTAFTANTGSGTPFIINTVTIQSDGKILIGGAMTSWNGTTGLTRILRLNSDGTRDTAFSGNLGTAANSFVNAIAVQSDGMIIVGGLFTSWSGTTVNRIVRLNSNGTRDTVFTTNLGTGLNGGVNTIAIQSDGRILVGGTFTSLNGATANAILRLNSNGIRDTAFTTNNGSAANNTVFTIEILSSGKIIIGGSFTTWNGGSASRITCLNSNGTLDTAFAANLNGGSNQNVTAMATQSDGRVIVAGEFAAFGQFVRNRIARLGSDLSA